MKTSPPKSTIVRFGIALSALGMAIFWPTRANAQVVDTPPHRIDFTVSPNLPKCDDYDGFYGVLVHWVTVHSIDTSAKRRLVVDIKRLPDGKKSVDLSLIDPEGVELQTETHRYSSTEECFKVLYWTAFDASRLLRSTIPPPPEDPPMSVEQLVKESRKVSRDKPTGEESPAQNVPIPADPLPTQCAPTEPPPAIKPIAPSHLLFGIGSTIGLTRMPMLGLRFGVGRTIGPALVEFDGRAYLPVVSSELAISPKQNVSARGYAYVGSAAFCLPKSRFLGCLVALGGVTGYVYDKPYLQDERFSRDPRSGMFSVGLRMGANFAVHSTFALRVDIEATAPIYGVGRFVWDEAVPGGENPTPSLTGFLSIVPWH